MADAEHYDAVVIGAGQGGGPLASALASSGRKTALIERRHPGGTCINVGCTPTKTMIASARAAYLARRAMEYGIQTGSVSVDMPAVRQRKLAMVESFRAGSRRRIEDTEGLEYVPGGARFTGPKTLEVRLNEGGLRRLAADLIVIDTGASPQIPPLPGLERIAALDSTTIMELDCVPDHLIVLGGGYVGVEFAQMFRRFGSRVTLVQRGDQLLPREDWDVAGAVAEILRQDGIDVLLNSVAVCVEPVEGGRVRVRIEVDRRQSDLDGSHLLLAVGRVPNTKELDLPATGIETDERGFIPVNERLETSVPGIYALGDVKGGPEFTHISYDDYRIIKANLLDGGARSTSDRPLPYVVFLDPQLGRIGLSERAARQEGRRVLVAKMPMANVARALEIDEPRGMMKAVVDEDTGQILGASVLGVEGGEIMSIIQVAMMGGLPYTALRDAVFAHPTLTEGLNNLFSSLERVA